MSERYKNIFCHFHPLLPLVCIDDDDGDHDVFLYNQYSGVEGGSSYIAGIPQFCTNGAPTRLCNDGTNSPIIINFACNTLGYQCKCLYNIASFKTVLYL